MTKLWASLLSATVLSFLTFTPSFAALITVSFDVEGGDWFQLIGAGSPFGLPSQPTFSGSVTIDNTLSNGAAFVGINYTTGSRVWTLSDIDRADSYVVYNGDGSFRYFVLYFTSNTSPPHNYIDTYNTVGVYDGVDAIACNNCVVLASNNTPVPESSTWAMMLLGFAGLGFLGYRRRQKLAGAASV
jgi:hypothetical protein